MSESTPLEKLSGAFAKQGEQLSQILTSSGEQISQAFTRPAGVQKVALPGDKAKSTGHQHVNRAWCRLFHSRQECGGGDNDAPLQVTDFKPLHAGSMENIRLPQNAWKNVLSS